MSASGASASKFASKLGPENESVAKTRLTFENEAIAAAATRAPRITPSLLPSPSLRAISSLFSCPVFCACTDKELSTCARFGPNCEKMSEIKPLQRKKFSSCGIQLSWQDVVGIISQTCSQPGMTRKKRVLIHPISDIWTTFVPAKMVQMEQFIREKVHITKVSLSYNQKITKKIHISEIHISGIGWV